MRDLVGNKEGYGYKSTFGIDTEVVLVSVLLREGAEMGSES